MKWNARRHALIRVARAYAAVPIYLKIVAALCPKRLAGGRAWRPGPINLRYRCVCFPLSLFLFAALLLLRSFVRFCSSSRRPPPAQRHRNGTDGDRPLRGCNASCFCVVVRCCFCVRRYHTDPNDAGLGPHLTATELLNPKRGDFFNPSDVRLIHPVVARICREFADYASSGSTEWDATLDMGKVCSSRADVFVFACFCCSFSFRSRPRSRLLYAPPPFFFLRPFSVRCNPVARHGRPPDVNTTVTL